MGQDPCTTNETKPRIITHALALTLARSLGGSGCQEDPGQVQIGVLSSLTHWPAGWLVGWLAVSAGQWSTGAHPSIHPPIHPPVYRLPFLFWSFPTISVIFPKQRFGSFLWLGRGGITHVRGVRSYCPSCRNRIQGHFIHISTPIPTFPNVSHMNLPHFKNHPSPFPPQFRFAQANSLAD